jgi:hypothetical protein
MKPFNAVAQPWLSNRAFQIWDSPHDCVRTRSVHAQSLRAMHRISLPLSILSLVQLAACGTVLVPADSSNDAATVEAAASDARAIPDAVADSSASDAAAPTPDAAVVSDGSSPADAQAPDDRTIITADAICGVSVIDWQLDHFSALYGARVGDRREVRLTRIDRASVRTTVIATSDSEDLCVSRTSLEPALFGRTTYFRAVWTSDSAVGLAWIDRDGAVVARGTTADRGSRPARATAHNLQISSGNVLYEAVAGADRFVRLAQFEERIGTAAAPVNLATTLTSSLALPSDVTSLLLHPLSVTYTRRGAATQAFSRDLTARRMVLEWDSPEAAIEGLGPQTTLVGTSGFDANPRVTMTSGARSVDVSYAPLIGDRRAVPVATETAWNTTDALAISVLQSPNGGEGVLWAGHGGSGYNNRVYFARFDAPSSQCLVAASPDEQSTWRSLAYVQRASRNKLLAMVRAVRSTGPGVPFREELWLQQFEDGQGICQR